MESPLSLYADYRPGRMQLAHGSKQPRLRALAGVVEPLHGPLHLLPRFLPSPKSPFAKSHNIRPRDLSNTFAPVLPLPLLFSLLSS